MNDEIHICIFNENVMTSFEITDWDSQIVEFKLMGEDFPSDVRNGIARAVIKFTEILRDGNYSKKYEMWIVSDLNHEHVDQLFNHDYEAFHNHIKNRGVHILSN